LFRLTLDPTQDMTIGDLRLAVFNYIVSKQNNENLIVRIEDIDVQKDIKSPGKELLELLNLFSIDYSQVLYQSNNLKYHQQIAMQFLVDHKAFNCFCSEEALQRDKKEMDAKGEEYSYSGFCENLHDETTLTCEAPFVVRLKKPKDSITFHDALNGKLLFNPSQIDSFTILKHNKKPTSNFSSAIDDMISDINVIIKNDTFTIDSLREEHIRSCIGYDKSIEYFHIPALLNDQITVQSLIDEGFLPVAIANYLVVLGFNVPKEIFSLEEAFQWFDITKISHDSKKFDLEELKQINKEHIMLLDDLRLSKILAYADEDIGKLGKLYLEEASTINELKERVDAIFSSKDNLDENNIELNDLNQCLKDAPFCNTLEELKKYLLKQLPFKEEKLSHLLRITLTGKETGPNLDQIYSLIKNYSGEIIR
jgi:glutamyl-tRNA synthetase